MIPLQGNWAFGFAFDLHTAYSSHLGIDENGNDRFENTYTEMGYLIHSFKYKNDRSALPDIIKLLDESAWPTKFDFIIPIPPTDKTRTFQPVTEIAKALGQSICVTVLTDILSKRPAANRSRTFLILKSEKILCERPSQSMTTRSSTTCPSC